jgi:hypothetical protein
MRDAFAVSTCTPLFGLAARAGMEPEITPRTQHHSSLTKVFWCFFKKSTGL